MSTYFNTNYKADRKKLRGWKRRIKQVNKWGKNITNPYLQCFIRDNNGRTYERCILYPFYTLDKRHPPLWFYKLIISYFISAYLNWEKIFQKLGKPFDLQLWLYDPAYICSEIICYKMEAEGQIKRFVWESDIEKPFPVEKFASKAYDITAFEWILADDAIVHFESDFDYADFTVDELLADGYIKNVQGDNEVYYEKRIGDIWVGRLKSNLKSNPENILQPYFAPPVL